jgi:hypothetical protein
VTTNRNKHTIEIWKDDLPYLNQVRKVNMGTLPLAAAVGECILAHKYCSQNQIDYRALAEESGELELLNKKEHKERESERI